MLQLDRIRHKVRGRELFNDLCETIYQGEVVLLRGANGSGKSTLLRICAGLAYSHGGAVLLEPGTTIGAVWGIGRGLFEPLTVRENLRYVCALRGVPSAAVATDEVICEFGLSALSNVTFSRLSTGQRQLASLASAFVGAPGLVLLDEPTVSLDDTAICTLRSALVAAKARGTAILASTHDQDIFSGFVSREIWLGKTGI